MKNCFPCGPHRLAVCLPAVLVASLVGCHSSDSPPAAVEMSAQLRRPVALVLVEDGQRLLVANRDSGTISMIHCQSKQVIGEQKVGERLSDLAVIPNSRRLLVADEGANELLLLNRKGLKLVLVDRLPLSSPMHIEVTEDGKTAFVSSQWARQSLRVGIKPRRLVIESKLDLPFAPRDQQLLPDGKHLVVADAFGGQFSLVDIAQNQIVRTRNWPANNMRGIALSSDRRTLLIPHQSLMSGPTTANNVHWGVVLMNFVRNESIAALFKEQAPLGAKLAYLGTMSEAAGDPTDIVVTQDNRQVVCYAGTNEIGISGVSGEKFSRVNTEGIRPAALAMSPDERFVYVANTFSDDVSVVDVASREVGDVVSLGPMPELSDSQRGEILFHDARLSRDGWFSCHSCHTDGHSNGLLNDNFGDNSTGAPKRVLSLRTVAHTSPLAWNGEVSSLDTQIRKSIETTMRGEPRSDQDVMDIAAYLESLTPPPSLAAARGQLRDPAIARGRQVFVDRDCAQCHQEPSFTTPAVYDVGLHDEKGNKQFNPPSLIGVSQRDRLFHDNRAASLRDVFTEHRHGLDDALPPTEVADLLAYLRSL